MSEEVCGLFEKYFWQTESWTPRNEAFMEVVVKQVRTTKQPWLIACNADFKKSLWFKSRQMFIEAPGEGVPTCRSTSPTGELIERTYDYVIASHSLQGKIKNKEVLEDFEIKDHTKRSLSW